MPAQPLRTANRPPALHTGLADPIMLSHGEACALIETPADGLDDLLARAGEVRDRGRGRTVTFSKKVFRSEEHTSELQSRSDLVCRLLLEKKKKPYIVQYPRRLSRL